LNEWVRVRTEARHQASRTPAAYPTNARQAASFQPRLFDGAGLVLVSENDRHDSKSTPPVAAPNAEFYGPVFWQGKCAGLENDGMPRGNLGKSGSAILGISGTRPNDRNY
jgi:hypothetical protein